MNQKVHKKLIEHFAHFRGMVFTDGKLIDKKLANGKQTLIAEFTFRNSTGQEAVMVLCLDKDLTESDSKELYKEIVA